MNLTTGLDLGESLLSRRNRYQFLATFLVNISTFAHGIGIGWLSPVMRALQTPDSPISFVVLVEEVSWIGSLLGIGSVVGNLLAGLLQDRIGRKPVILALTAPYVCFWLLSYFAQSVEYLYLARLLAGVTGGAGYIVLPIFISEISDAKIRGRLSSMVMLSVNMGILTGYILSTNVDYYVAPFFILPLPVCYFISNLFLPETPFYLINKGKFGAAERSFRYYKNIRDDDKSSMLEFEEIKVKLTKERALSVNAFNYKDFLTRPALKAYSMAILLIFTNQFTGTFCFASYMSDVFTLSHTTLDIGMCTIIIGVIQIVGTYTTTLLCDRFGRKILLLISSLGCGICLATFGSFTYFAERYDLSSVGWMPLLLLSLDVFLCNIGLVGVLFVVLVEQMPAKIRSVAVSGCIILLSSTVFLSLKIFPLCMEYWGISITMWSCSLVAFVGFILFLCFLKETKGKSMLEPYFKMLLKLLESPNCLLNRRNRYQFLSTLLINLICIAHGIGVGWLSPTLRKIQSVDSPLDFSLSISEISWVGSAQGLGAVVGNILMGLVHSRVGSRLSLLFIAFPHSCLWILVYFAKSAEYLFIGRFLAGITSGGLYVVHPIFLSEISDSKIRGTFGSMVFLSVNVGVLLGYILGTHLAYHIIPFVVLILPISYFISNLFFIRESPMHLIRKGKYSEAEQSFRYYKNIREDTQNNEMHEFDAMKEALTQSDKNLDRVTIKDFLTRPALKAYGSAAVLSFVSQCSGLLAMISYMSDIFALSGSTMDPDTCTIVIGIIQILGTYTTTLLCDIWGRRILLIVSSAGVAFSLTSFGLFSYYAQSHDLSQWSWAPLLFMSLNIYLGNIGLMGCYFVVIVEIFPLKIRTKATSAALVVCGIFFFVSLKVFPVCMDQWGIPLTMWSCAGISAFGFFYFVFSLKETMGKSMLED
ncbi:uncharacterized protein Dmoj_GI16752 [Drosophila mojavensis]|uniref:Major facilitator superfamily (MFS) profile domain-containing protein n=1 Tax=Drosophila mojavensis TaxID=7230 RepID=B4KG78_DROMO|nr:uncharacterized protein Dmoj_GI16752 [Drosophila mojavensis]